MASAAKDVALLALQHSDKVSVVIGAVFNFARLIVYLKKEKNKNDCILALHAGKGERLNLNGFHMIIHNFFQN